MQHTITVELLERAPQSCIGCEHELSLDFKQVAEIQEEQAVPEQASSSSELAAVDFMSSDEEVDQAAAACDSRFDSSDDDAKSQQDQRAELRGDRLVPVSKRGRAPDDSRFGSPEDKLRTMPANMQLADHRALPVSQLHSDEAAMVEDDSEDSSCRNSQQSEANSESSGAYGAENEHESAPTADDPQFGSLQRSGKARPLGQFNGLNGTSASSGAQTEGHEDADSDDIRKGEPSTSTADARPPHSGMERQQESAEEACVQHEGEPPLRQQPSAAVHKEKHACGDLIDDDDAEQLREQHEQQKLQGKILSTLNISKSDW